MGFRMIFSVGEAFCLITSSISGVIMEFPGVLCSHWFGLCLVWCRTETEGRRPAASCQMLTDMWVLQEYA
jgi:hypothetical protein